MKTALRYFKHHAKDTLIRAAIITFICLVIVTMVAQGVNETYQRQKEYSENWYVYGYSEDFTWTLDPSLGFFVAFSAILTTLLPMLDPHHAFADARARLLQQPQISRFGILLPHCAHFADLGQPHQRICSVPCGIYSLLYLVHHCASAMRR